MIKKILILTLSLLTINLVSKAQVELTSTSVGATYYVTVPGTFVLTPGLQVTFKANVDNSASMSLDVSGTGAKPIRKLGGSQPLSGSDILTNQIVTVAYDGSNWQMISAIGSTPTAPTNYWSPNGSDIYNNNAGNVTVSGDNSDGAYKMAIGKNANSVERVLALTNTNSFAGNGTSLGFRSNFTGTMWDLALISGITGAGITSGDLAFGVMQNRATSTMVEAMRIQGSTGNIGIGTTAPAQKLEIQDGHILLSNTGTQSELRFKEASVNGGNIISFKAPAALAANVNYTLPINVGAANDVLSSSDGAGTLSWVTPSPSVNIYNSNGALTGARIVTQGANTLAFTATAVNAFSVDGTTFSIDALNNYVGIGTAPALPFDVANSTQTTTSRFTNTLSSNSQKMAVYGWTTGALGGTNIGGAFESMNSTGENYGIYGNASGNSGNKKGVYASASGTGTNNGGFFTSSGGTNDYGVYTIATAAGTSNAFGIFSTAQGNGTGTTYGVYGQNSSSSTGATYAGYFENFNSTGSIIYGVRSNLTGNAGGTVTKYGIRSDVIGTASSNVGGYFRAVGGTTNHAIQLVDGFEANNRVLASDAAGNATWTDLSAISSGSTAWTRATPNIYPTTLTDNVGIGTSTPGAYKLNVNGNFGVSGDGTIESVGTSGGAAPRISYGFNSSASGGYGAMGVGYTAVASGTVAIALGQSVTASGYSAVAIGQSNTASGGNATAIGYGNTAAGTSSSAFGSSMSTSAAAANSFGIGLSATTYTIANPNTMAIMGGKVGIGTVSASESLEVSGNVELTSSTDEYMINNTRALSTNGTQNVFVGNNAATGSYNTIIGYQAGNVNTGISNTFVGRQAGLVNTGGQNAFFGILAGSGNTLGQYNTFIGRSAGDANTTGNNNTILGGTANVASGALTYASAIGYGATIAQSYGMALGGTGVEAIEVGIGVNNNMAGKLHAYSSTPTYNITGTDYNSAIYGEVVGAVYSSRGIMGVSWATGTYGIGAYGAAQGAATNNYGVYGIASGGTNNYAGYFDAGNVYVTNNLGIGVAPSYKLHVQLASTGTLAYFDNNTLAGGTALNANINTTATAAGTRYGLYSIAWYGLGTSYGVYAYGYGSGASTTNYGVWAQAGGVGGSTNWAVYASGNQYSTTGTAWTTSDEKFKNNIQRYSGALDMVNKLDIKTYYYDTEKFKDMNLPQGQQFGFLAQDLEKVFPEMVMDTKLVNDDMRLSNPNNDPNYEPIMIDAKVIKTDGLIPVALQAIKEQQVIIEELKQQIANQKARIDALENK